MSDGQYFVSISEPSALRKNLLLTAKLSVQIVKAQHTLRDIRKRKHAAVEKFSSSVLELQQELDAFKQVLPAHDPSKLPLRKEEKPAKAPKKASVPKKAAKKHVPPKPQLSPEEQELEHLERKLREIETKLNKL